MEGTCARRYLLIALTVLLFTQSCALQPSQAQTLTEAEVLAIARNAVAARDSSLKHARFDAPKFDRQQNWWTVLVRDPPAEAAGGTVEKIETTGGGHRIVVIDNSGKVIKYIPGR